jgi:molybdopterin-guanine dinucleotide biosynthesis protein MobB
MKPALLAVVGKKGCGKSQVIERLILNLKERGFRIGLIKHLAKAGVEIDQPGKDTYRYRKCGAQTVVLSGQSQWAVFSDIVEETPLEKILLFFEGYDLVLLEGYFLESVMKIEVHRAEAGDPLTQEMEHVLAIVSDIVTVSPASHFTHAQVSSLAPWIEDWMQNRVEVNARKEMHV